MSLGWGCLYLCVLGRAVRDAASLLRVAARMFDAQKAGTPARIYLPEKLGPSSVLLAASFIIAGA